MYIHTCTVKGGWNRIEASTLAASLPWFWVFCLLQLVAVKDLPASCRKTLPSIQHPLQNRCIGVWQNPRKYTKWPVYNAVLNSYLTEKLNPMKDSSDSVVWVGQWPANISLHRRPTKNWTPPRCRHVCCCCRSHKDSMPQICWQLYA